MKQTFFIKGMHCASCVYLNEKALLAIDGVKSASVNLTTQQAVIETEKEIDKEAIKKAIEKVGYQVEFIDEENEEDVLEKRKKEEKEELSRLKRKLTIGLLLSGAIVFGSFPGLMNFAPKIFQNYYFQFLAATIVQFFCGWQFYQSSMPALKNRIANMDVLVAIGTSAAYFYSVIITFFPFLFGQKELMPYFDVSSVIITLILLGRYLEAKAKSGTSEAIKKLMELQPKEATLVIRDRSEQ